MYGGDAAVGGVARDRASLLAMAAGARALGARIVRRCRATNITRAASGEWLVETQKGTITCEHVVNAGGTYARQMGEWSGLQLPMTSMTHHYLVTEEVPEFRDLDVELPVVRDDRRVSGYIRMEQNKGLIGIYEKENPNTVWEDHCPWEAENELFEPDYDRLMPYLEQALQRMPVLENYGIKREVHGAIPMPPDGNMLLGPAPGLRNYWCCCGSHVGIAWGPGAGKYLAQWMVHGAADISMASFDPRRFGALDVQPGDAPSKHLSKLGPEPLAQIGGDDHLVENGAAAQELHARLAVNRAFAQVLPDGIARQPGAP